MDLLSQHAPLNYDRAAMRLVALSHYFSLAAALSSAAKEREKTKQRLICHVKGYDASFLMDGPTRERRHADK